MNDTTMTNTPATTGELAPCPFCGGAAELIPMRSLAGDPSGHRVWCPNLPCCAAGPALETEADAIAAWNHRAPLAPAVADVGTLAAIDGFVDAVIDGVYDSYLDAYDVQEWAVDRGIIARVECGGMDGDCEICAESDTDYHYTRVLYARDALATAAQPALAVPERAAVEDAIDAMVESVESGAFWTQDIATGDRAALLALIYGDAPADASENGGAAILAAAAALTPADDAGAGDAS